MRIAFLINERALRAKFAKCVHSSGVTIDEYSTAAKALGKLSTNRYDLIVIHWKVHPGLGSGDPRIDELAMMIPNSKLNRNVFYWEVGMRVLDTAHAEDSANRETPAILLLPELDRPVFADDQLTKESVESDIAARQPA